MMLMPIKILICDDRRSDAKDLRDHIMTYAVNTKNDMDVLCCSESEQVVSVLQNSEEFDIIFLDIYMDKLNGMEIAQAIREYNNSSRIVFFSTSRDHALEAYGVNAVQYLVKPVAYADIEKTLELILKDSKLAEKVITVNSVSAVVRIRPSELVCSETEKHYQIITLAGGSTQKVRISRSALYDLLAEHSEFINVGASFIINMKYVIQITSKEIVLDRNKHIPVPRGAYPELRKKYFDYYTEE